MNFLRRMFQSETDLTIKRAENLVDTAKTLAIASYTAFLPRHPLIAQFDEDKWDFVLTIAGVCCAISSLNEMRQENRIDENAREKCLRTVTDHIKRWDRDGLEAIADLQRMINDLVPKIIERVESGNDAQFAASDAIGTWITWNLLNRAPNTKEESLFVRDIGAHVALTFIDWWVSAPVRN